jgi:hypothetical protein
MVMRDRLASDVPVVIFGAGPGVLYFIDIPKNPLNCTPHLAVSSSVELVQGRRKIKLAKVTYICHSKKKIGGLLALFVCVIVLLLFH